MTNKIFKTPIPSWVVMLFIAVTIVGIGVFVNYFSQITYDYELFLPDHEGGKEILKYGSWPELGNKDFFEKVKLEFLNKGTDFIEADLSVMLLRVYKAGVVVKEVKILSKGRDGSWWETPAGIYKIQSKEENHFSSFGRVYMPWSMAFQGNFFIHGWPYYPGGEPVAVSYSGGCIRLATDDAREVFDLVKVGTPVLVFERYLVDDGFIYKMNKSGFSGRAYLAADLQNNFVFVGEEVGEPLPIASITKLMTAVVATEYANLESELVITPSMLATTSLPRLKAGQEISAYNLLYPLLLESSNEAANALASFLGTQRFVDLMNEKAKSLGMLHTTFVDPSGIGEGNISTTEDLFVLAKYIYNNRSFIFNLTAGRGESSFYGPSLFKDLRNFNDFHDEPGFVGGKVGETRAAGQTILSIFSLGLNGAERPIVFVVLGSKDRAADVRKLLNYVGFNY